MKFRVTMKTPDALDCAIKDAASSEVLNAPGSEEEDAFNIDELSESMREVCSTWFKYGEYLTVEIDTEAKTCVVCNAD